MQYRNTKTGALIETACPVSGENWVEVKAAPPEASAETAKVETAKASKKSDSSKE